ncbi:hypothetical protein E2I00_002482 [Balaenoptera physalus]|nr:hypothetical protein E2I00_002482 [Balaenoptera physalus]
MLLARPAAICDDYNRYGPATQERDTRDLFIQWENLIYILRPPVEAYSSTQVIPARDTLDITGFEEESKCPVANATYSYGRNQDQVSIRSLHINPEVFGATYYDYAGEE